MRGPKLPVDPYFLLGAASILLVGGTLALRSRAEPEPAALPPHMFRELDSGALRQALGASDAPIQVTTLSDYECEGCAVAHERSWPVVARYVRSGLIRYTVYETPLPGREAGIRASVVGRCVAMQSEPAFWAYHHAVFAERAKWLGTGRPDGVLSEIAFRSGADTLALQHCLQAEGDGHRARAAGAWPVVSAAGGSFVPLWTVQGKPVNWLQLEQEIQAALRRRGRTPSSVPTEERDRT